MNNANLSKELPRRLFSYYVLFSLLALVSSVVGMVLLSERTSLNRFESKCLNRFHKEYALASIAYQQNNLERLQQICDRKQLDYDVNSCAVYGPDGKCMAHTNRTMVDQRRKFEQGDIREKGDIRILRYNRGKSRFLELSQSLGRNNPGTLVLTLAGRNPWLSAAELFGFLSFVLVMPLGLVGVGGVLLHRKVRPLGNIFAQLSRFAGEPSQRLTALEKIPLTDSMSVGWNCLLDEIGPSAAQQPLESRLSEVVDSRRRGRYENAIDSLPDGIAETDIDGQLTFINNAMTALLGEEDKHDVLGVEFRTLLEQMAGVEQCQPLFDSQSRSRAVVTEIERTTPFGARILRVARHPISPNSDDPRAGQAWSIRDVTQQKLADRARDEFLDSATHELRTPLASIKAYAETLSLDDMSDVEQQKEFCNIINAEATRLARFIDELLDVSSIEAGSLHVTMQKVEVDRLLEDVVAKVRPLMNAKNITLETTFAEKLPEIPLDKEKFSTCLVNLLGNAAKYTPAGGHVEFRAIVNGDQLIISITDDGIGIAEDELPRVFDKFFRSEDDLVQGETGTGLGLAFANEVAKLHQARLTVESRLREGTIFTLSLTIAEELVHV